MKNLSILLFTFLLVISCSSNDDSSDNSDDGDDNPPSSERIDWASSRADTGNTSFTLSTLPDEQPELLRSTILSYSVDYNINSLIAYEGIAVITDSQFIEAVNLDTGERLWSKEVVSTNTSVAFDNVFVNIEKSQGIYTVYGIDIYTGATIWSYEIGSDATSNPLISNGNIFICSERDLLSLNVTTGELIWIKDLGVLFNFETTLASDNNLIYLIGGNFSTPNATLFAVNKNSSDIIWELSVGTTLSEVFLKNDNLLYTTATTGRIKCISKTTQELKWEQNIGGGLEFAMDGNYLITFDQLNNKVMKIDINTGGLLEPGFFAGSLTGNPIIANNKFIYPTSGGVVVHRVSDLSIMYQLGSELNFGFFAGVSPISVDNKLLFMTDNVLDGSRLLVY